VNKNLSIAERDELLKDIDQMLAWGRGAVTIARDFTWSTWPSSRRSGRSIQPLSIVRESDGASTCTTAFCAPSTRTGT
jgi:hypothetical protein